jgi:hypothetical protein
MIRDRIRELRRVKGRELQPHPKNWRRHSKTQADALAAYLQLYGGWRAIAKVLAGLSGNSLHR